MTYDEWLNLPYDDDRVCPTCVDATRDEIDDDPARYRLCKRHIAEAAHRAGENFFAAGHRPRSRRTGK